MQSTSVDIGPIDADVTMPSAIVTTEILSVQTLSHDGIVLRQTTIEMFDLTMDTIPLPSHVTVKFENQQEANPYQIKYLFFNVQADHPCQEYYETPMILPIVKG
jgi:hypothetical protein